MRYVNTYPVLNKVSTLCQRLYSVSLLVTYSLCLLHSPRQSLLPYIMGRFATSSSVIDTQQLKYGGVELSVISGSLCYCYSSFFLTANNSTKSFLQWPFKAFWYMDTSCDQGTDSNIKIQLISSSTQYKNFYLYSQFRLEVFVQFSLFSSLLSSSLNVDVNFSSSDSFLFR